MNNGIDSHSSEQLKEQFISLGDCQEEEACHVYLESQEGKRIMVTNLSLTENHRMALHTYRGNQAMRSSAQSVPIRSSRALLLTLDSVSEKSEGQLLRHPWACFNSVYCLSQ